MITRTAMKTTRRSPWALAAAAVVFGAISVAPAAPAVAAAPFAVETFEDAATNQDLTPATQAGSHPFAMTTTIVFAHHETEEGQVVPDGGDPKNVEVNLPVGMVANPTATPRCPEAEFEQSGSCPAADAVGVAAIETTLIQGATTVPAPIYNLVPPPGVPAEFGFNAAVGVIVHIVGKLRTGGDYGLSAEVSDITQKLPIFASKITLWGNPSDKAHDTVRGECAKRPNAEEKQAEKEQFEQENREHGKTEHTYLFECPLESRLGQVVRPFLTMPSSCGGLLAATMTVDSWQEPDRVLRPPPATSAAITGCERLDFSPSVTVKPDTATADSPSGLTFDLTVPQEESVTGLAEANLKDTTVSLPVGMAVSPSAANGLGACTQAEIGLHIAEAPSCPDSSKIGDVEIVTPLLEQPLKGAVYLAQQGKNPFGSLLALYLVAEGSGALIKLAGHVEADPTTGQLRTTFAENPELPFNELKLRFYGGPRAPLVTPPKCGAYQTNAALTAWSGQSPVALVDTFTVMSGCGGGFAPSFSAGTTNNQGGAFTPFSVTFARQDGEQRFGAITVHMPPGLLGKIAGMPLCGEAPANVGACSPASQIGTTTAGAGAGPDQFYVPEAGQPPNPVYLTGPYKGAPFGLSIVTHALAGPFDLGNVIVRAAINVDPTTAQITVTSDPLPTILQGIPLDIRTVNVTIDRAGAALNQFMFNPTNCEPAQIEATLTSPGGTSVPVASRFQAANCSSLAFKPSFSATTASNGGFHGATLDVKISQKPGEAAIHKVDTQLPLALPSRLVTLQKACPEAQFAANPAGCPPASDVGTATAHSPVLNVPLTGPAYLVSHGGAAFPDLDIILQGEGVTIDLVGNTDIKKGITYSRFETVPDAPISSFELNLPGGPGAVLAATKNLCTPTKTVTVRKRFARRVRGRLVHTFKKVTQVVPEPLVMPTTLTGQNGAVTKQNTKIAVTGCAKPTSKKLSKPSKRKRKKK